MPLATSEPKVFSPAGGPGDGSVSTARASILGLPVDVLRAPELIHRVGCLARKPGSHLVCYVNTDCVNQAVFDRRYRAILQAADLVYADGTGVVWASRLTDRPLPERITLGDALPDLCRVAAMRGLRLFFLGGRPGAAHRAADSLQGQVPGLQIVGAEHGFFTPEEEAAVIAAINQASPDILLVGMGVPKQEKWLWQHRDQLRVPVLWGVGAVFEYFAGDAPRAPVWLRRLGFEGAFRLLIGPPRLWKRYLLGNAFFVLRVAALPLVDAALVAVAWLGVYAARSHLSGALGVPINPVDPYLRITPLIVGIWLAAAAAFGSYRRASAMPFQAELAQVARAVSAALLITMAAAFLLKEADLGRSVILPFGAGMCLLLTGSRLGVRWLQRALAKRRIGLRRTLVVGSGPLAWHLREEIETWAAGYEVIGFVRDDGGPSAVPADEILGSIEELEDLIHAQEIHEVFVSSRTLKLHEKLNLLVSGERWPVNFHIVAEELEPFARRIQLGRIANLPVLELPRPKTDSWYEVGKRTCDAAGALIGLAVSAPIMALIAMGIKLESEGPVRFSQQRVGKDGRLFSMYKFRTMRAGTPAYAVSPNDLNDPRVTRFGRFLRRWSLDELPQLINVLKGEMSVIGPRPEMPFLVAQYQPWQRARLSVRPGLTGLWQVVGRKELPLNSNLEYDLYYVRHCGWRLDAAILVRTIPAVLVRRGAF